MVEQTSKPPRRIWRIVFVMSLALNLAFIGLIGGAVLRGKADGGRPPGVDFGVGPLGRALSPQDRRDVGRAIRDTVSFSSEDRGRPQRVVQEIQQILRADDFDKDALENLLDQTARRYSAVQQAAQAALIDKISSMNAEERAAYADRLDSAIKRRSP